jgi:hypothetical protein
MLQVDVRMLNLELGLRGPSWNDDPQQYNDRDHCCTPSDGEQQRKMAAWRSLLPVAPTATMLYAAMAWRRDGL